MQANFSAAYDCSSLKLSLIFIIKPIKMLRQTNCTSDKKPLPAISDRGLGLFNLFSLAS